MWRTEVEPLDTHSVCASCTSAVRACAALPTRSSATMPASGAGRLPVPPKGRYSWAWPAVRGSKWAKPQESGKNQEVLTVAIWAKMA